MERNDSHPSDDAWLDLAHEVCSPQTADALEQHLREGCDKCRAVYSIWKTALAAAGRDQAYEPPADSVRAVKSAFSLRRRLPFLDRVATAANLLYDSFREPLPAGFRGNAGAARLLLHEAGNFRIDLRVETDPPEGPRWIAGHIVKSGKEPEYTSGSAVLIRDSSGEVVAQTFADKAGEFQVRLPSGDEVTAYVEVPDRKLIRITIPGSSS